MWTRRAESPFKGNAMHLASHNGRTDLVRLLLDCCMNVNMPASDDLDSALHRACSTHWVDDACRGTNTEATITLLLERGAGPTLRSKRAYTPLHSAAAQGNDIWPG
jgi:ankyrin repeat protein